MIEIFAGTRNNNLSGDIVYPELDVEVLDLEKFLLSKIEEYNGNLKIVTYSEIVISALMLIYSRSIICDKKVINMVVHQYSGGKHINNAKFTKFGGLIIEPTENSYISDRRHFYYKFLDIFGNFYLAMIDMKKTMIASGKHKE